jgi:hypothetical protein
MNKLVIFVLVAATLSLASCSSTGFTTADDYGYERRIQSYDPYAYGPGVYGANRYGYGNSHRNNFRSYERFGNGYERFYNPFENRRRPTVIYRSNPSPSHTPGNNVRPINPRKDRWNPNEEKSNNKE